MLAIDQFSKQFVADKSKTIKGELVWKPDSSAVWRPGGCLNATAFLPKGAEYLRSKMGGKFQMLFGRKVVSVTLDKLKNKIDSLTLEGSNAAKESLIKPEEEYESFESPPGKGPIF